MKRTIKDLSIKVTYEVGLGNVNIPKKAFKQLIKAYEKGDEIEMQSTKYPDAEIWLNENIRERDCMEWKSEIIDLVEQAVP